MTLKPQHIDLTDISAAQFLNRFGGLYEHSPWVAEAVWPKLESQPNIELAEFARRLRAVVDDASQDQKLTLLRAHPELAGKAAIDGELTAESTDEQSRARLDLCTPEEFQTFQRLNSAYNKKFKFPFIMAVRNSTREEILTAFEARLDNSPEQEFDTALEQVHQIALLRLQASFANIEGSMDGTGDA